MVKKWYLLIMGLVVPAAAQAQGLLPNCSPTGTGAPRCELRHFWDLLLNVYNFFIGLAVIVFMLMMVVAGVYFIIVSAGGGEDSKLQTAKTMLRNVVIGFALVLAAFLVVNTILTILGVQRGIFDGIPILQNFGSP